MRRALGCAALALALLVPAATANAETGTAKLRLGKPAARAFKAQSAAVRGLKPAVRRGRAVSLPVRDGQVGSIARVRLAGGVRIAVRKGKRRRNARLRAVAMTIRAGRALLTAKLAGTQYTLGRLRGVEEIPFNPITGEIDASGQLRLGAALRRELRSRLRLRRVPKTLGRLRVRGTVEIAPPSVAEPELAGRPESALDVTGAVIDWRIRESFVCYLHAQGGPGLSASDGAVLEPPVAYPPPNMAVPCTGDPGPLSYTASYPQESFLTGWFDPVTGASAVHLDGSVRFAKDIFNLDIGAHDPIVEVAPGGGRLIHTYVDNAQSPESERLAVTATLELDEVDPIPDEGPGSTTYTYERVPLTTPGGPTAGPLAAYYPPHDEFGWVTVSFTVPEGDG